MKSFAEKLIVARIRRHGFELTRMRKPLWPARQRGYLS
jgi:hypothetical protein